MGGGGAALVYTCIRISFFVCLFHHLRCQILTDSYFLVKHSVVGDILCRCHAVANIYPVNVSSINSNHVW